MDFSKLEQFVNTVNVEQIEADIAAEGKTSRFFDPGKYTLKIIEVDYHINKTTNSIACPKDSTWFGVKVVVGAEDGRTKDIYLQIPTSSVYYNKENSKAPLFVFKKLTEFMASIGVKLTTSNVTTVIKEFFDGDGQTLASPDKLLGQSVTLEIGYNKNSVQYTETGEYVVVIKRKPLLNEDGSEMTFPDKDAAKIAAAELGFSNLQEFPEILRYYEGSYVAKEVKKAAW